MIFRCEVCGMLTFGANPPEACEVCGSNPSKFSKVDQIEDVNGTETEENLKKAFSGESQANRRYILFAQTARMEGNPFAENLFLKLSYEETWHALSHLLYLLGGSRTAEENIVESIKGETYEADMMYKEFAAKAEEEGFDNIARIFTWLANTERGHADKLKELLNEMRKSALT